MDTRRIFAGDADGRFERAVCGAVVSGRLAPEALGRDVLLGRMHDGRRVLLIRRGDGEPPDLAKLAGGATRIEVVWIGGDATHASALGRELADTLGPHEHGWLVTDDGAIVPLNTTPPTGPALTLLTDEPPDWAAFWGKLDALRAEAAPPELRAFGRALEKTPPRVTVALGVVIVLVYGFGALWGAPDLPPALYRMGALAPEKVLQGEVWRMVSSMFLHGGLLHLAANTYVLWVIGRTLERILGSARFLVLYTVAGIGGSLLSLGFTKGVSVGASGAIWGLMTAMLALSLQKGVLPEPYRVKLRSSLVQTVLLNVVISLAPGIDWAAHAGGGIVGLLLGLSGLLTAGMPRWAELGEQAPDDRVPAWARVGAPIAAVVLAGGLLTAIATGRPWVLRHPPTLGTVELGGAGWTIGAPAEERCEADVDPPGVRCGDLRTDMGQVQGTLSVGPVMDDAARAEAVATMKARIGEPEEGVEQVGAVEEHAAHDGTLLEARFRTDGIAGARAVVVRPNAIVYVEAIYWDAAPAAWGDAAREMALSARGPDDAGK